MSSLRRWVFAASLFCASAFHGAPASSEDDSVLLDAARQLIEVSDVEGIFLEGTFEWRERLAVCYPGKASEIDEVIQDVLVPDLRIQLERAELSLAAMLDETFTDSELIQFMELMNWSKLPVLLQLMWGSIKSGDESELNAFISTLSTQERSEFKRLTARKMREKFGQEVLAVLGALMRDEVLPAVMKKTIPALEAKGITNVDC